MEKLSKPSSDLISVARRLFDKGDIVRKLVMSINISLDGFADHTIVSGGEELHEFFSDLLDETGAELFGRITYDMMASYWPEAPKNPDASKADIEFANRFNAIPKYVFSSTLEKADWNNTTLVKTDAIEYVKKLKQTDGKDLHVGGITLAASLIEHGLVDEYWVVVHPVIVREGRRFLENVKEKFDLKLLKSKVLKSGAIALHYEAHRK